ncbi:MAG: glycosyltransferase family 1 protein [Bacteroidota bacterium]
MIKVFFDHQKFTTQRYGGISRYFSNIIDEIKTRPEDFEYQLGILYSKNYYIKDEPQFINQFIGRKFLDSQFDGKVYTINDRYCRYLLKRNNFDIFHPTYYDTYFLDRLKKPFVTTIHDMTHEMLPEYFWAGDPLTINKRLSIERADKIIAISQTTKKDLLNLSNVKEEKIDVIYHGIDTITPLEVQVVKDLPEHFVLFVGDRSGYKNFYLMIQGFAKIHKRFPDLRMVLTGGGTMEQAEIEYIRRLNVAEKIIHIQVSDSELNYLYQKAALFLYPSLYEGFGLPILEAFRAQCPILLSNTECFNEIALDAAVYFDPYSLSDLVAKLESIIHNSSLRNDLIKKGNVRLLDFPLKTCNEKTLSLYQSLI